MDGHKARMDMYPRRLTAPPATVLALSLIAVAIAAICVHSVQADEATTPFRITSHDPPAHEVGVDLDANINAIFDEDVNAGTLTNGTFVVHGHLGGLATGTFAYDPGTRRVRLDPSRAFHGGEVLRVSATAGILNTGGTPLTAYGWQFTAGPVVARTVAGFVEVPAGLTGVNNSSVAWGDYDNDGDLDILLTGFSGSSYVSEVYRNDGGTAAPVLVAITTGLIGVGESSAAWGDYDNDGDLDILLTGDDGTAYPYQSKLYRNDGGGVFADSGAVLTAVHSGSVAWGDYDNDGDLDILLTGQDGAVSRVSKVYRNDGGAVFTDIGAGLTDVYLSSAAWGDYDNDGDLDILIAGSSLGGSVCQVYRNDGGGAFTDIGAGLPGVTSSSLAWGDYDNDGDLDILLTGDAGAPTGRVSRLYRNDGASGFIDTHAALTRVQTGSVAWGDYDNDGDLDILLTGYDGTDAVSKVYRNNGGGAFVAIGAGLTGVQWSSVAWGDYEGDGDQDILLTGHDGSSYVSKVYRNNAKPNVDLVVPDEGSGPVASTVYFTTTWSDPDGSVDLKQCYFHIGASPALAANVTLLYNERKDKLWMLDDTGTTWTGGYTPGSPNVLENSQARVYCADTDVHHQGTRLAVVWAIRFRTGFEGTKKLGLKAKDIYKAKAKGAWKGRWNITP